MILSISGVVLLGVIVFLFFRKDGLKLSHALVSALFGFYLASSAIAPSIKAGGASLASLLGGSRFRDGAHSPLPAQHHGFPPERGAPAPVRAARVRRAPRLAAHADPPRPPHEQQGEDVARRPLPRILTNSAPLARMAHSASLARSRQLARTAADSASDVFHPLITIGRGLRRLGAAGRGRWAETPGISAVRWLSSWARVCWWCGWCRTGRCSP